MTTPFVSTLSIDWGGIFGDNVSKVISFVPKLIIFLVVLFIGWLIAKAIAKAVGMILGKVGFDRLLAKAGADRALAAAEIRPIDLIAKLVYYFVLLIALQLALTAFGQNNPVSQIVNNILNWLPKAFVAIIIVVIAGALANAVKDILGATLGGVSYGSLLARIASIAILALGIIAALNQAGIGLSVTLPVLIAVLATISGILIVGVGGGLVGPMRSRWEGWLTQLAAESKRGGSAGATTGATGAAHAAPTTPASTQAPPPPPAPPTGPPEV